MNLLANPSACSVCWLVLALTTGGGLVLPDSVRASNAGVSFGNSVTNPALAALGKSFVALVENPNHRGPNQETQQLVIFRNGPASFQVLRKWLGSRTETNQHLPAQWDLRFFDEVVSVVSNHAFSAIIPTRNILEYRSLDGNVLDEVERLGTRSLHAEKNLLIRNIKLQQTLYSSIALCGIPMVVHVNASLGNNRYSVQTYQTNDATLEFDSEGENRTYVFRLFVGDEVKARSVFHASALDNSSGAPRIILQSEKRTGNNGDWKSTLTAKLFAIPDTFPAIEDLHSQIFHEAFMNGGFVHRDSYSNGIIYSVSKIGNPVPISTRPTNQKTSRQSPVVLVRAFLVILSLAGLALLLKFSLKPANKKLTN